MREEQRFKPRGGREMQWREQLVSLQNTIHTEQSCKVTFSFVVKTDVQHANLAQKMRNIIIIILSLQTSREIIWNIHFNLLSWVQTGARTDW